MHEVYASSTLPEQWLEFYSWSCESYLVHGWHGGVEGGTVVTAVLPEGTGGEATRGGEDHGSTRRQGRQQTCGVADMGMGGGVEVG